MRHMQLSDNSLHSRIALFVDSKVALGALEKGISSSSAINGSCRCFAAAVIRGISDCSYTGSLPNSILLINLHVQLEAGLRLQKAAHLLLSESLTRPTPLQTAGYKDSTFRGYRRAVQLFITWLLVLHPDVTLLSDLDRALANYVVFVA